MLAVSMDCLSPVSCEPNVGSLYGLSFVLCLVSPMLAVSMDCLSNVSCEPNVGSVYGLSLSCVL